MVVIPCFQLEDVFKAISALDEEDQADEDGDHTRVLVIDSVYTHFKDMLMSTSAQGHAELVSLMQDIAELTYSRSLLSIVTNSTASSQPTNPLSAFNKVDIKPALGTAFTFCTDATLLVQETGRVFGLMDEEERERIRKRPGLRGLVEVIRSRISPTGKWAVFETVSCEWCCRCRTRVAHASTHHDRTARGYTTYCHRTRSTSERLASQQDCQLALLDLYMDHWHKR